MSKEYLEKGVISLLSNDNVFSFFLLVYKKKSIVPLDILVKRGFVESDKVILLRTRFWDELRYCYKNGYTEIDKFMIYGGVCRGSEFISLMSDKLFCNYLLCDMFSYSDKLRGVVSKYSHNIYDEVLNKDLSECSKTEELKWFNMKLKVLDHLEKLCGLNGVDKLAIGVDARVDGMNVSGSGYGSLSLEELQDKLKKLENEMSGVSVSRVGQAHLKDNLVSIGHNKKSIK